jgi:single-strand DNA-binding protein
MSGINKAILLGNVGRDPEIRRTQDGRPIASFPIATSETWRDKDTGERKERTQWHNIVCFNEGLCKVIEQYVKKGSRVLVEGLIETRKWTHQDGTDRYTTEIVLRFNATLSLEGGSSGNRPPPNDNADRADARPMPSRNSGGISSGKSDMDDDIPF